MNNPALTHNDLDAYIGSYRNGLIDGHELVCITKACVRNEPMPVWTPFIEASETLHVAFTPAGIQALVTRIQGSREIAEEMLISVWSVSADGKKLSAPLLLHGDLAPKSLDANDHEWIMPRIEFPMPDGCLQGEVIAEQHRKLRITEGLLHFE